MKILFLISLLFALATCAKLLKVAEPIENRYIVVFHQNTTKDLFSLHMNFLSADKSTQLLHTYENSIKGYAATITSLSLLQKLMSDPIVNYVEQDQMMYAIACDTQANAPSWGLPRISAESPQPPPSDYRYTTNAGEGVNAYILDTGILTSHNDFGGRATFGFKADSTWSDTDGHGHGTHVASTVGGTTYGVAKKVTLIAVKVLSDSGSGSTAGIISGVDWVASQAQGRKCVANMSLGGGFSQASNDAVDRCVNAGVVMSVSAGNDNGNAANKSPASAPLGICVGSTVTSNLGGVQLDTRSTFSNYGPTVDIFAPGSSITAAWIGSNTATNTISGTSMATPHVCGATALLLSDGTQTSDVKTTLLSNAKANLVTLNCGTSDTICQATNNKFLFTKC